MVGGFTFALAREKNSFKYYMFKNKVRRNKLKSRTHLLNVLMFTSAVFLMLSALLFVGTFIVWLVVNFIASNSFDSQMLGLVVTIVISIFTPWFIANFLSTLTVDYLTDIGGEVPRFALLDIVPILIYIFIAFVFVFVVLKFAIEWKYILEEARELKSSSEENKNQIALSEVIIKVKKFGLISTIIVFSSIAILTGAAFIIGTITSFVVASLLCITIFISYIITTQVFSSKKFRTVHETVYEIREKEKLSIIN